MKEKFRFICIPIIILSMLMFLHGTVCGGIYAVVTWIVGGVLMFLSLVFTVIAMIKNPLICIGTVVLGCISSVLFTPGYYYNIFAYTLIVINIIVALAIIYTAYGACLTVCKNNKTQTKPQAVQPNKPNVPVKTPQPQLADFAQELQEYKYLLDNGILTENEFATQKAKIMEKYGITVPKKTPVYSSTSTTNSTSTDIGGDYDMGTLILTISERMFYFKNKENKTVVIQGTFLFDKFTRTLTLFKPDKSVIKLSINQDGNLVLPNGMVYKKL